VYIHARLTLALRTHTASTLVMAGENALPCCE
jgi:hypothetical protein